jgi:hypothetical protein
MKQSQRLSRRRSLVLTISKRRLRVFSLQAREKGIQIGLEKTFAVSLQIIFSSLRLPDGLTRRGDINVLLLGDPGTAKSQLLKFVERVSPIGVR